MKKKSASWDAANERLISFDKMLGHAPAERDYDANKLKVGVDLGTSSILTVVLDENDVPLAGLSQDAMVVRDGVVVEFSKAIQIVIKQRETLEGFLGTRLTHAAAAIPPGVSDGNQKAVQHVLQGAGYEVSAIVDESTAAATFLGVSEGAVVDVGGGTTGISVIRNGQPVFSADEPTGGHHMTLVLAGSLGIPYGEAEITKRSEEKQDFVFQIIRPVVEKMAAITAKYIVGYDVKDVYISGGASAFRDFEKSFGGVVGVQVHKPEKPWLVTPLGIAMYDR
ncbi:MAG: ethanolamine utilization protein EutJ [Oscillospiraceae bacterium]